MEHYQQEDVSGSDAHEDVSGSDAHEDVSGSDAHEGVSGSDAHETSIKWWVSVIRVVTVIYSDILANPCGWPVNPCGWQ